MTTRDEIKVVIGYMMQAFPNYHPSISGTPNAVDVYLDLLGDIPIEDLWIAVKTSCAETGRQFAPSAGEIRGAIVRLNAKASGMPEAGEAWGAVMESFRRVSSQRPTLLDHPLVAKTIHAMGGLERIGMSEDNMADRAHFLRIYEQFKERALEDAAELPEATEYIHARQLVDSGIGQLVAKLSHPKLLKVDNSQINYHDSYSDAEEE